MPSQPESNAATQDGRAANDDHQPEEGEGTVSPKTKTAATNEPLEPSPLQLELETTIRD